MSKPMTPSHAVHREQAKAFDKAMAERLGLDPGQIVDDFHVNFETDGDMARVTFQGTAYLPTAEVLAMFNGERA